MDFEKFQFYGQSIHNVQTNKVDSYELLLRINNNSANYFPKENHLKYVKEQRLHKKYTRWLKQTLQSILTTYPDVMFSFNLDHQELEYEETFQLLEDLQDYKRRLNVEITETVPLYRTSNYYHSINIDAFRKIAEMGYKVTLDDISEGMNSLGNLLQVKEYISRVKVSTLHFDCRIKEEELKKMLCFFSNMANFLSKELVIEGIEDASFASWLKDNISGFHQGYFYAKPKDIWAIL